MEISPITSELAGRVPTMIYMISAHVHIVLCLCFFFFLVGAGGGREGIAMVTANLKVTYLLGYEESSRYVFRQAQYPTLHHPPPPT